MDVLAERAETFPLRRAGEAREIVGAALYLATRGVVVHDRDDPDRRRRRAVEHAGRRRSAIMSAAAGDSTLGRHCGCAPCTGSSGRSASRSSPCCTATPTSIWSRRCCAPGRARAAPWKASRGGCCTCSTCRRAATSGASASSSLRVERRLAALSKELDDPARGRRRPRGAQVRADGAEPEPRPTWSRGSTAISSARCCAPATASATCAGARSRRSAPRPRTSSGSGTRLSCGATGAGPSATARRS